MDSDYMAWIGNHAATALEVLSNDQWRAEAKSLAGRSNETTQARQLSKTDREPQTGCPGVL